MSDWQTFRKEFSPLLIGEVIDRSEIKLPDWFVPLARGVAIASDTLLRKAAYRHGSYRPRGWRKTHCDVFEQNIGPGGLWGPKCLVVRGCGTQHLWTVERWGDERLYDNSDEVLVSVFGSPPIFTRSYQSAMRLAAYCHANGPPAGLCWTAACPKNYRCTVEIARECSIDKAHCAVNS
jgi:hypothetical protein